MQNWWRYWKYIHEYSVEKQNNTLKGHKSPKIGFPCLFTWEWNKQIPFWNCSNDNYKLWNSKLSYLNQFQKLRNSKLSYLNQFQWIDITIAYYQLQWKHEKMKKICENMFPLNDNIEWHWKQLELYQIFILLSLLTTNNFFWRNHLNFYCNNFFLLIE